VSQAQFEQQGAAQEHYEKVGQYLPTGPGSGRHPAIDWTDIMKISQMTPSKYLRQSDVSDDTIVTVKKVGQANIAKDNDPPEVRWLIRFAEFDQPMVLNRTNIEMLGKFLGDDSDDWIGGKVILFNDESVAFAGKITGGLRFKRVGKNAPKHLPPTMENEDAHSEDEAF